MYQQTDRNVKVAKSHNVAILLGATLIESQPVARDSGQIAKEEVAFRARRGS
jgi:hypothetical protein